MQRTHTPTQGAYITQYIMHKVAEALGVDEALVHEANMLAKKHLVTNEAGERLYKTPAVDFVVPEEMYTAPHIWKLLKVGRNTPDATWARVVGTAMQTRWWTRAVNTLLKSAVRHGHRSRAAMRRGGLRWTRLMQQTCGASVGCPSCQPGGGDAQICHSCDVCDVCDVCDTDDGSAFEAVTLKRSL